MAGFGSMMPGMGMPIGRGAPQLQPMQIPPMAQEDNAATGMKILQAALQRQGGQQGGVPAPAPGLGGGPAPMSLAPPEPGAGVGMLSGLLGRMAAMGAPLQNQGGMGPAPSALTGLW